LRIAKNSSKFVFLIIACNDIRGDVATDFFAASSYYPCVFVLKPGQLLHINKGRLHAFRKMSTKQLEANDCHSSLRKRCIVENNITTADCLCMSVAWDWMYRGVTQRGIQDEVIHSLNSASLARNHGRQSLAIPQLSLIETAKYCFAKFKTLIYLHASTQKQRKF
jgi:hypothetical protein